MGARFRRRMGRSASLAVALVALLMLVAGGASHQLFHADEGSRAPVASSSVSAASLHAQASTAADTDSSISLHGCSGHCGAHSASQAPLLVLVATPAHKTANWGLDLGHASSFHPSSGPDRPPRV
jgi:hypothetical protein